MLPEDGEANRERPAPAYESMEDLPVDGQADTEPLLGRLNRLWDQPNLLSQESLTGRALGKYQLQQVVGAGSFGVVYLARDRELEIAVALKLPRLEILLDTDKRERFSTEAAMMTKLDHPKIVRVFEARLDGPQPYIASEFCDGPNLAQWLLDRQQQPSCEAMARLVADITDAVEYAHCQGVLHRDLKPANVLLVTPESAAGGDALTSQADDFPFSPRLTDFGLAKFSDVEAADTRSSQMIGTPLYMAPERIDGSPASIASEVYSLGVVLFEVLTGQVPIDGDGYLDLIGKIRRQPPRRLRSIRRDAPRDLERICEKCLHKEPKARYQSAAELGKDLRRCVANEPVEGRLPNWPRRLAYWCARPERIPNAGWFAIISHLVLIAWIAAAVLLLPLRFEFEQVQWIKQVYEMLYGVCFSFAPIVLGGWLVLQRHRWAVYGCFLITLLKIPAQLRAMVYKPMYFADLYETGGVYVFMDHFIVAVLLMFQLFIFACAMAADLKLRARH